MASLEDIQQIRDGAEVLAAGATLGLDPDQTLAIAGNKREQVRENIRRRRADRANREGNRAQAEAYLADNDANFRAKGGLTPFQKQLARGSNVRADIDDEAFAFGEDAQVIYDDDARRVEREERRPQDDYQNYSREEKVRNDVLSKDFLQPGEVAQQREGRARFQAGGQRGMADALQRLQMAKDQYGFAAFGAEGAEMERIYNRLRDNLEGGGKRKDRDEARKAVLADAAKRRGDLSDGGISDAADKAVAAVRNERGKRVTGAVVLENGEKVRKPLQGPAQQQIIQEPGMPDRVDLVQPFAYVDAPEVRFAPEAADRQSVFNAVGLQQQIVESMADRRSKNQAGGMEFRELLNDAKVGREANDNRNRNAGLARQLAEQSLDAIPPINQLGAAGPAAHGVLHEDNLQFGGVTQANNFGIADPLVDAKGRTLGYFGDENGAMVQLGEVNSVDSANTLNAPAATPMQKFVAENQPAFGKNGVFGVPEVDFNEAMALVGDRIRGLGLPGLTAFSNPRNIAEVEQLMGKVVHEGQKAGKQFFRFDKERGANVAVSQPGVAEVMNMMRVSPAQQEMVAFALMQNELGNAQDINQEAKQAFRARQPAPVRRGQPFRENVAPAPNAAPGPLVQNIIDDQINMNAAEQRVDGGLPIDMIKNEKFGRGKNARGVKAALAAIDQNAVLNALNDQGQLFGTTPSGRQVLLPEAARIIEGASMARNDAQMPMQAAIKGEGVQRARFVSPAGRKMSESEMVSKYGAENAAIAREVMDRYERDEAARNASPIDPGAELQRRKDAEAAAMGRRAERDFEDQEIGKLVKLMRYGRQFPGNDRFEMEGDNPVMNSAGEQINKPVRIPGAKPGEVLRVPDNIRPIPIQRTSEASVPMSIAPEPGAGTGNQSAPMVDAGGASRSSVTDNGPMPASMREELFALPRTKMSPFEAQMAQNTIKKRASREKLRNRAAMGGAGLAGLAGILGLSNIGREEEEEAMV